MHTHPFLAAALEAWNRHGTLVFSCEDIYLMLLQSFADHVKGNTETLRSKIVNFEEGKKKLVVETPFARGFDWTEVVEKFVRQIQENVSDEAKSRLFTKFTDTPTHVATALSMTAMLSVSSYFDYQIRSMCGFRHVRMQGRAEDWDALYKEGFMLVHMCEEGFAKKWWPIVGSILAKFKEEYSCQTADEAFWNSMVLAGSIAMSGGERWINGWILAFFPSHSEFGVDKQVPWSKDLEYVKHRENNGDTPRAADASLFTDGTSVVDVDWIREGVEVPLKFVSGFLGVTVKDLHTYKPEIGWFIAEPTHVLFKI